MQAHQPLSQRLGVVAHGIERRRADGDMAVPDMESIEALQRRLRTIANSFGNRSGLELLDFSLAM